MISDKSKDRAPRSYRPPEIQTDRGCTYNRFKALGMVYGINVPFASKLAKDVRDEEGFFLWSSPRLVLTIAEAHDAYRNNNAQHSAALTASAIEFCNSYLPEGQKLPEDAILRLTWIQYGIASISCEERRSHPGTYMDIVKHGVNTMILNAPWDDDAAPTRMETQTVFTATGTPFEKPQREERYQGKPRSSFNPNRPGRGSYGGKGGGQRGLVGS